MNALGHWEPQGRTPELTDSSGGCQNYGPFWIPVIIRHLILRVPKKGS